MTDSLQALRSSVEHLAFIIDRTGDLNPEASAYPTEWSISDTLSHIGSGAVIMKKNAENVVTGKEPEAGFNKSIWDTWNAKSSSDQVTDALVANTVLLEYLDSLPEAQRSDFHFFMGLFNLDFAGFVGLRLNEQALHTWDVDVALHPSATLDGDVASAILDNIQMIVGFAGKANGTAQELNIRTTGPARDFTLLIQADSVSLSTASHEGSTDFELPSESLVRLISGRLDLENAPVGIDHLQLESLQKIFPGF